MQELVRIDAKSSSSNGYLCYRKGVADSKLRAALLRQALQSWHGGDLWAEVLGYGANSDKEGER